MPTVRITDATALKQQLLRAKAQAYQTIQQANKVLSICIVVHGLSHAVYKTAWAQKPPPPTRRRRGKSLTPRVPQACLAHRLQPAQGGGAGNGTEPRRGRDRVVACRGGGVPAPAPGGGTNGAPAGPAAAAALARRWRA